MTQPDLSSLALPDSPERFAGFLPVYREDWTIAQNILAATAAMKKAGTFETMALCWPPGELELLAMYAIDAKYKLARLEAKKKRPAKAGRRLSGSSRGEE